MESWELLRGVFKKHGCKRVAGKLGLSLSLIHKWSRPRESGGTGELNPLDRIATVIRGTGDLQPLHWLCRQFGGHFVPNPKVNPSQPVALLPTRNWMMLCHAQFFGTVARAMLAGGISPADGKALRRHWDEYKSKGEEFVQACERGGRNKAEARPGGGLPLVALLVGLPFWLSDTGLDDVVLAFAS